MSGPDVGIADLLPIIECGRRCAVSAQSQRDLQKCASKYSDLFPGNPFDPTLLGGIADAHAFCAPWLTAEQLRMANRISLWAFGLDWEIDYLAKSRSDVDAVVTRCLDVDDGGQPGAGDCLGRFLAELRSELAAAPAFASLGQVWRDQLERTLDAMAREWDWKAAYTADGDSALPSFEQYLANADNLGFSLVYVAHWICTGEAGAGHVDELMAASWEVQRAMRLINDLGTYKRDLQWGDLNVLMLGVTQQDVMERIALHAARCQELLAPLRAGQAALATYLERMVGFNMGFHPVTDYWGTL